MDPNHEGQVGRELPVGTLTFFRSDVEGSMRLTRALGARYDELNVAHHSIVSDAIEGQAGQIVRTEGDGVFAVFDEAAAAANAAIAAQRSMAAYGWPDQHVFRIRIGLHTGSARRAGNDYGGFEVARAARIAALGWGGQTILSEATRGLLREEAGDEWLISDLGRHRLKGIVEPERIFQLGLAGETTDFPPLRSTPVATDHLPERVSSFVGREAELDELADLLTEARLLTLTGPGGTGKTTLAIALARRHAADYADGAWFVDLQGVDRGDDVLSETAHGLGLLDGSAGPAAHRLLPFVAERELLIVIDNFEQVIEASSIVEQLLAASPRSRLIVTSRVPLRLSSEQAYPVQPLAMEHEGPEPSDAVRLFIDRARRIRPGEMPEDDLAIVREVCERLDGLPLAIELAAASVGSLPVRAIRDRLAEHLPLPGSAPRDLPERQRTVEATLRWSHDLLTPPLQHLLMRLGVFEGSVELEQAEAVCGPSSELGVDVLVGLTGLVEHSLLFHVDDTVGGIRYGMLETVRAFAASRLAASDEADEIRARHMAAYHTLIERDWPLLDALDSARLIDRVEVDDANVRAAVTTAIDHDETRIALAMVGWLWRAWLAIGRLEDGRQLIARALAMPGADEESRERVMALDAAGGAAYWSGDLAGAASCYEEQLRIAERRDDPLAVGLANINLYFCRVFGGDAEGAERALGDAKRIAEEHDVRSALASVDIMQSVPVQMAAWADPEGKRDELEAMTARFEAEPDPAYRSVALAQRAMLASFAGDFPRAARSLAASIRICLAQRDVADAALYLMPFVMYGARAGRPDIAATVLGAVDVAFERLGIAPPMELESVGVTDPVSALTEALGVEALEAARERGRRMSLLEATDYIDQAAESLEPAQD